MANPCSDCIDNDVSDIKEGRWHQTLEVFFPGMSPSFLPKMGESDYSIAIPYAGPHPTYEVPHAQPSKDDTTPNRRKKKKKKEKKKNKNMEEEEEEHIRRSELPESANSPTLANGPPELADSARIGRHRPIHQKPPELTVSTRIGKFRRNKLAIPSELADSTKIGPPHQNRQAPQESMDSARIGGLNQNQQVLPEPADSAKNGTACQNQQDSPDLADSVRIGGICQKRLVPLELADSARIGGLDQNLQVPPESACSESHLLHSSSFSFPLTLAEPSTMAQTNENNTKVSTLNHDINPDFTFPQHNINCYGHKHGEESIISMAAPTKIFNGNGIFSMEKMEIRNVPNGNEISLLKRTEILNGTGMPSMRNMENLNGDGISSVPKMEVWNGNGIYSIPKTENRIGNGIHSIQETEIRNGNGIFLIQKTEILNGIETSLVERMEIFNGNDGISSAQNVEIPNGRNGIFLKQKWRRGKCHLCLKGHILQETETCLVCCAKYCLACVLQAMGSMPEGRKCEKCIGKPIDERKRGCLGKPSRLLSRILGPLEIQQVMQAEKQCLANQLRPEQIVVNGKPLKLKSLAQLLTCNKPPLGLKPGRYWYDKQSGLWGKEGEKPDRIIEADLDDVGGELQDDASNGNTLVYINERQIRKRELKMLKFAGVQCPPGTRLWVEANGNYKLEGIKNVIGNIWDKKTIRLLYQIYSLPVPQRNNSGRSKEDAIVKLSQTVPEYLLQQKKAHKILLLGFQGSGTSTIFKQAKFLYSTEKGFTKDELQEFKLMIQCNIYKYISILIEACERFEEDEYETGAYERRVTDTDVPSLTGDAKRKSIYSVGGRLKKKADWFLEVMANGNLETYFLASAREYAPLAEELWRHPAIQAAYNRRDELDTLPDVAKYFLERAVEVSSYDYEPSECDVIYTEGLSQASSVAELEFTLDETSVVSDKNFDISPTTFRLVRVSSKGMNDGCKWLDMFEDVKVVIFCVALSDYDQMWRDGNKFLRNKMMATRDLFECIARYPSFRDMPFVLILNKYDIFEEKIQEFPLMTCDWFSDFDPVQTSKYTSTTLAQQAYTYIAHKFKKLFECVNDTRRKLYTFQMKARDRSSVALAFDYVQEIINWEDSKGVIVDDITDESISTDTGSALQV